MRRVRTIQALLDYLTSINCSMSRTTVNKLIRNDEIPYVRISERVVIFDLDAIDTWLSIGEVAK